MYQEIILKIKPEMNKVVEFFLKEMAKIRTGSASPALIEDVQVDISGQKMLLKQIAAISSPERRQLVIQPWDRSYLEPIEKALQASSIGSSPVVEKDIVRLMIPQLTQELRENLSKILSEKSEEARKTLRKWRDEAWSEIQEEARNGTIREDDKFKGKEELQKVVDEYMEQIEKMKERKEKEITEV